MWWTIVNLANFLLQLHGWDECAAHCYATKLRTALIWFDLFQLSCTQFFHHLVNILSRVWVVVLSNYKKLCLLQENFSNAKDRRDAAVDFEHNQGSSFFWPNLSIPTEKIILVNWQTSASLLIHSQNQLRYDSNCKNQKIVFRCGCLKMLSNPFHQTGWNVEET